MKATVVVVTRNRRDEALRAVERARALPECPRVILVDNGSRDGTAAAAREVVPRGDVLALGRNRGGAARNLGVLLAETPYVAFADDDTWWEPGAIARAVETLDRHPRVAVVTARVLVEPGGRLDPACAAMARSPLPPLPGVPGRPVLGFLAGASVVRRSAFLATGGFSERFGIGGEEELVALDLATAGHQLVHDDRVVVHHAPSTTERSPGRPVTQRRNHLTCVWLRLPAGPAVRATADAARRALHEGDERRAILATARWAAWIARHRRVVPAGVAHRVAQVRRVS